MIIWPYHKTTTQQAHFWLWFWGRPATGITEVNFRYLRYPSVYIALNTVFLTQRLQTKDTGGCAKLRGPNCAAQVTQRGQNQWRQRGWDLPTAVLLRSLLAREGSQNDGGEVGWMEHSIILKIFSWSIVSHCNLDQPLSCSKLCQSWGWSWVSWRTREP